MVCTGTTRCFLFDPSDFGIKSLAGLERSVDQIWPAGHQLIVRYIRFDI